MQNKLHLIKDAFFYDTLVTLRKDFGITEDSLIALFELLPKNQLAINFAIVVGISNFYSTFGPFLQTLNKNRTLIKEITLLYKEFLHNYSRLNKLFNFNNPVEIYTMFYYFLFRGYLSSHKTFLKTDLVTTDLHNILGVNVLAGKSACRHNASLLTNILENLGFEAYTLTVFEDSSNQVCPSDSHLSFEEAKLLNANHAITLAYHCGSYYFLDPTQTRVYQPSENPHIIKDDNGRVFIYPELIDFNKKKYTKLLERLAFSFNTISKEEIERMINNTLLKCHFNSSIFEEFYRENEDLYLDVSDKLSRIKKQY